MKSILACHDGSAHSGRALKKALEIAARFDAAVTVLSVIPELYLVEVAESDRQKILASLTAEARKTLDRIQKTAKNVRLTTMIRQGEPATAILAAAKKVKADLIVTGSHGRHGAAKFLLGSVSSRIVDYAPCSVMVVK